MQVFLIRHAEAVDETLHVRDPHRPLTAHGRTQARSLGEKLQWYDCGVTHVWASPLVRAVQTAELVIGTLDPALVVEIVPALAPEQAVADVVAALRRLPESASVLLVGHEPSMSSIGALVLGARDLPPLGKAEAARIVDGQLRWRFAWNADAPTS